MRRAARRCTYTNPTMSHNYDGDFVSTDDEAQMFNIAVSDDVASRYGRGDHSKPTETDASDLRTDAQALQGVDDDAAAVLGEAAEMLDKGARINAYECPECGLRHNHSRTKHVLSNSGRGGLKVRSEFAERMVFNKRCHCAVNELEMLLRFKDNLATKVFTDIENDDLPRKEVVNAAVRLNDPNEGNAEVMSDLGEDTVAEAMEFSDSNALRRVIEVRETADTAVISADTRERIERIASGLADDIEKDPLTKAFERHMGGHRHVRRNPDEVEQLVMVVWEDLMADGYAITLSDVRDHVHDSLSR